MKVLLIEDSEIDAELVYRDLRKNFKEVTFETIANRKSLIAALHKGHWDIVLSDYNLPGFGAIEALQVIHETGKKTPFIVISGAIGEELAADLMRKGADDLILKSNLQRLTPSIHRSLRESELRLSESESKTAAERAIHDREQMLAVVTHDLKNPLTAIKLNIGLLQRMLSAGDLTEREQKIFNQVDRVRRSTDRMDRLISDILDVAKMESGNFVLEKVQTNVSDIVSELLDSFETVASEKGILLETKIDVDVSIVVDYNRIYQALANLLSNALKFTPPNGSIEVSILKIENYLIFSVKDSGSGIPQEDIPFIFDRFWQAKKTQRQGTGLGLAIVQGIVMAHDGKLEVSSEMRVGTEITFRIPLS